MASIATLGILVALGAAAPAPTDGKAALERLKALAGDWQGQATHGMSMPVTVRYEVGSNGTIVKATQFAGTDHEMMNVFYVVGSDLMITHYCAMGNQPQMKLKAATADALEFDFSGGSNFVAEKDQHVHSGRLAITSPDRLEEEWDFYSGGKPSGSAKLVLSRKK